MQGPSKRGFPGGFEALVELGRLWFGAMPLQAIDNLLSPVPVPPELLATLTEREPYRTEALADAPLWLARGRPLGLGLEMRWQTGEPWEGPGGEQGLSRATFEISWVDRMDPFEQQTERVPMVFDLLLWQAPTWRVARLLSEKERAQHHQMVEMLRQMRRSLAPSEAAASSPETSSTAERTSRTASRTRATLGGPCPCPLAPRARWPPSPRGSSLAGSGRPKGSPGCRRPR